MDFAEDFLNNEVKALIQINEEMHQDFPFLQEPSKGTPVVNYASDEEEQKLAQYGTAFLLHLRSAIDKTLTNRVEGLSMIEEFQASYVGEFIAQEMHSFIQGEYKKEAQQLAEASTLNNASLNRNSEDSFVHQYTADISWGIHDGMSHFFNGLEFEEIFDTHLPEDVKE